MVVLRTRNEISLNRFQIHCRCGMLMLILVWMNSARSV